MSRCIIVQGDCNPEWLPLVKEGFKGFPTIYSTWEGTDTNLFDENDIVLYNPIPEWTGVSNLNLQKVSSLKGFHKAKAMGFERVVKWRSDFYCPNTELTFDTFKSDKFNFYAWHKDNYVTDFFMEGDIDEMIALFSFEGMNARFPEEAFTDRMFELGLDSKVNFVCKDIFEPNDIKWLKQNYWLSFNTLDNDYKNSII